MNTVVISALFECLFLFSSGVTDGGKRSKSLPLAS